MKGLSVSETAKHKDTGKPKIAPKKQKKKMEGAALIGIDVSKEADLGE
jgi:prolyl-tRNA synthetase